MVVSLIVNGVSLEAVVNVVGSGELDGFRLGGPGTSQSSLETDWVDLGLGRTVHGDDLVSDEVVSAHQWNVMSVVGELTYPAARPEGILKVRS